MDKDDSRLVIETTLRQLERMRGMQYAYHAKFFQWLTLIFLIILVLAIWGGNLGRALLPFVVVSGGVTASFFLHFCDFARLHASMLEKKLNRLLPEPCLFGAECESIYFYPLDQPKLSGWVPQCPGRFFSAFTLHWTLLWTAAGGGAAAWAMIQFPSPERWAYAGLVAIWIAAHVIYLTVYFLRAKDLKRMQAHLETHLLQEKGTAPHASL